MEKNYTEGYFKKNVGKSYDKTISNRYELFINSLEEYYLKKIIKKHYKNKPKHLDFACGTGRILNFLKKNVKSQTGIDTAKEMIKEAKNKVNAKFYIGNILENQITKEKFDLITSFRLFLNLNKQYREPILKELKSYLDEEGLLVVNNHMNRYSVLGFYFFILNKILKKPIKRDGGKIINTMSECEFRNHLKKSGYKIKKTYRFGLFPGRINFIILPEKYLFPIELFISKIPIINLFCKDQIYVCEKPKQTSSKSS